MFWSALRLPHRNDGKIAKICKTILACNTANNLIYTSRYVSSDDLFEEKHFYKDGVLAELQAKTSRGSKILLF